MDVCGRIVEVGSKVYLYQVGDLVYGSCNGVFGHGAFAQFVQVSQDTLALVPEGVNVEDLGTIATVGMTTYQAMKPYVKAGGRVFINGGSGGTGVLAIQVAKALGCHVTTSCSSANVELCKSLGADKVLDYKAANIIEQLNGEATPFNLILDNVGTPPNLYRVAHGFLVPSGTFVQVGLGMSLSAMRQIIGNVMLPGFLGGGKRKYVFAITRPTRVDLQQLAAWVEKGKIRAVVDSVYGFGATPEAFTRLKTGRARGKVVVRVKEA